MEYTEYKIDNEITLLPPLLKMFSMFQIHIWYNKEHYDQNNVENIVIRCSNCGSETGLSTNNMDTNYKDIITSFVLNTVLHHVYMSWIIVTNQHFEYYMDKRTPGWMTGGPWYNTYICKNI